jgi:hypothetical protein
MTDVNNTEKKKNINNKKSSNQNIGNNTTLQNNPKSCAFSFFAIQHKNFTAVIIFNNTFT